ncbi:MAG TPA: fibronectin type III domain-containing protein [Mycolicibacterium fallax]|nr:fibronectin type III domain-containing protein [Mycolicibacterium fallax]
MSVNQVLRGVGQWSIKLKKDAPPGVLEAVDFLGHIAIVPGRINAAERGDELLSLARYVGILRDVDRSEQIGLSGVGMAAWLGDEDGKGDVIEAPGVTLTGATFAASIAALLPAGGAVTAGTLTAVAGTYTGTHTYQTPRTAISYVCDLFDAQWRVNGDGTLDAGPASALFRTTPEAMIVRQGAGYDHTLKALPGDLETKQSAKDATTRVVVVGNGLASGSADVVSTPYRDIHGNDAVITRVVDEQDDTAGANATARAQAVLNLFSGTRRQLRLRVDEFDVAGDFEPGDTVWVYDPTAGVADPAFEVTFRGQTINPVPVRVLGLTWPISAGHSVGFRSSTGVWTDLTPWVAWESGGGEVEVADSLSPALTAGIGTVGTAVAGGGGGAGDASIPGVPTFGTFTTSAYQPGDGVAQAQIKAVWTVPLNTDASTIVDGDHFEIRYRPTGATEWAVTYAGWDQTSVSIIGLNPSTTYEFQIRAVDYASPINYGAWSATTSFLSATDTTPPATPAPPTVAASLIAVQVTHTLGKATGGTFNLPLDMDHFEVHVGTASGFTPSNATLAGKLAATGAMITGSVPAVGTFATDPFVVAGAAAHVKVVAVDRTGNRSPASSAVSATASLIDSAHISDLTASKITAGTISAPIIIGTTATFSGALSAATGTFAGSLSAATGTFSGNLSGATVTGGLIRTSPSGQRIEMDATNGGTIWFRDSGSDYAFMNGPGSGLGINSGNGGGSTRSRTFLTPTTVQVALVNSGNQAQQGGQFYATTSSASMSTTSGPASVTGQSGVFISTSSGQAQLKGGSGVYVTTNSGPAQLYTNSGSASVTGTSGVYCTTDSGTALFGSANNNYVQCTNSGSLVNGGGGAFTQWAGSTIAHNAVAHQFTGSSATTSFGANAFWYRTFNGQLYDTGSTRAIKRQIEYANPELSWTNFELLKPVTYFDRMELEEVHDGDESLCSRQLGLIAEDVAETPGLGSLLAEFDDDGAPKAVNYERLAVAMIPLLKDLNERVKELEEMISELRAA